MIDLLIDAKVRRINCSSHSYPKQRKATASSSKDVIIITELTMSDLEAKEENQTTKFPNMNVKNNHTLKLVTLSFFRLFQVLLYFILFVSKRDKF